MLCKIDYLETREILAKQREVRYSVTSISACSWSRLFLKAILIKIREMSRSHVVYPPLPQFLNAKGGESVIVDWKAVPGLRKSPESEFLKVI